MTDWVKGFCWYAIIMAALILAAYFNCHECGFSQTRSGAYVAEDDPYAN